MVYRDIEKKRAAQRAWVQRTNHGYDTCICGKRKRQKSVRCSECHQTRFCNPHTLSEIDFAWIAGILEGEGCWTQKEGRHDWSITVKMTDQDIIERLQEMTGVGKLYKNERVSFKDYYTWTVSVKSHREWLTVGVWPWLGKRRRERIKELWPEM